MDLHGKAALITGGARMGESIASRLAEAGYDICLTYQHSRKAAENCAKTVQRMGRNAFAVQVDLTSHAGVQKIISRIRKKFGRLDVLIHLASIYEQISIGRLNDKKWDESMAVHLKSAYQLALGGAKLMNSKKGGRIIFISDWTAASGRPRYKGYLHYYTAKAGILGLTEALALELAPRSVLVNAIAPGPILAPAGLTPKEASKVMQETPLKKWGGTDEISKAVLFLIQTGFVTGECLRVDGGRHLW